LTVVDVSNPAQPGTIGSFNIYPSTNSVWNWLSADDVRVVNNLAYLVGTYGGMTRLFALDVRDPSQPVPVGYFETPGFADSLWVDGNHVYVAGYNSPLLIIETPFNPQPASPPTLSLLQQNGWKLRLQGERGFNYTVEYADGLSGFPWQPLQTILLTNQSSTLAMPTPSGTRFFRAKQLD
jgi:hypothetical protein